MTNNKHYLCPECGSAVVKAGRVVVNRSGRKKQQWQCMTCRRRTLNPVRSRGRVSVPFHLGTDLSA